MMWSRTSTAYTGALLGIIDTLAQDAASGSENARQACGEIGKRDRCFEQHIQSVVGKQAQRLLQTPAISPCRAVGWRDHADLARHEPETAAVECAAERHRNIGVAIPAELEDRSLVSRQAERRR